MHRIVQAIAVVATSLCVEVLSYLGLIVAPYLFILGGQYRAISTKYLIRSLSQVAVVYSVRKMCGPIYRGDRHAD